MSAIRRELSVLLAEAFDGTEGAPSASEIESSFEIPREEKFGDLSTHIALRIAKETKKPPRELAERIVERLRGLVAASALKERISSVHVEGLGFINFHYSQNELASVLPQVKKAGGEFGKPLPVKKRNILIEFVSANPTGPLTVAHGRQAALGDSLARILRFCGHKITTEYYNNDEGAQIVLLGRSIRSRYLSEIGVDNPFPEDGYKGEYITDIACRIAAEEGKKRADAGEDFFARYGKDIILKDIQKDLKDFGVAFDNTFSQEALMKSGKVEKALQALRKRGFVYEKEGAVWFQSTRLGDDKDRVLVKSDKSYTYLLPDAAYHRDKFERKFDFLIDILGPDHHGYVPRIKAAVAALGLPTESLEVLIAQLVTLYEGGKQVRMSTRAGEFVTLREILEEVGRDAARFFFLMRKFDAHLDFDLALAKSQTLENPVFYIQYAHARIESIKKVFEEKFGGGGAAPPDLSLLSESSEIRLLRLLGRFEETVWAAEKTLEPYRLVPYLIGLAGEFHRFYIARRVVTDDAAMTQARMMLVLAVQQVIRTGLSLLGISAPLKM